MKILINLSISRHTLPSLERPSLFGVD